MMSFGVTHPAQGADEVAVAGEDTDRLTATFEVEDMARRAQLGSRIANPMLRVDEHGVASLDADGLTAFGEDGYLPGSTALHGGFAEAILRVDEELGTALDPDGYAAAIVGLALSGRTREGLRGRC